MKVERRSYAYIVAEEESKVDKIQKKTKIWQNEPENNTTQQNRKKSKKRN